eukprot:1915476-Prymnesium_polylepis.2
MHVSAHSAILALAASRRRRQASRPPGQHQGQAQDPLRAAARWSCPHRARNRPATRRCGAIATRQASRGGTRAVPARACPCDCICTRCTQASNAVMSVASKPTAFIEQASTATAHPMLQFESPLVAHRS